MISAVLDYLAVSIYQAWEWPVRIWHARFGHGATTERRVDSETGIVWRTCWACGEVVNEVWTLNGYDEFDGQPRHWKRGNILGTVHSPTVNPRAGCPGCVVSEREGE